MTYISYDFTKGDLKSAAANFNTRQIPVTIHMMQQKKRPASTIPMPALPLSLIQAVKPTPHFYRYIYNEIGGDYYWATRRYLDDDQLRQIIHDPNVYIYILYTDGVPMGMAELDHRPQAIRQDGAIQLKFFGLIKEYHGRGIAKWFLQQILCMAWDRSPSTVILETCSADDKKALQLYQKSGFSVYGQNSGIIEWRD